MLFYKQVLEFYFTTSLTLGYSIFSRNDQIAALYWTAQSCFIKKYINRTKNVFRAKQLKEFEPVLTIHM